MNMYAQPEAGLVCIQCVQAPLINSHSPRLGTVWLRAYQISHGIPFIPTADRQPYPANAQKTTHLYKSADR